MLIQTFTLLWSLSILVLTTGKLEDKSDIKNLLNAWELFFNTKKFVKAGKLLTPNVTYEPELTNVPVLPLKGVNAVVDYLKKIILDNISLYTLLSTKLIKFIPLFNKERCSDCALAVMFITVIAFGVGNLTEEYILALKFVDKEIVRTKEPGFGGWNFQNRELILVVSFTSII